MAASNSPLKPYANAFVLAKSKRVATLSEGRWSYADGNGYLVRCFMKRQQYTGVSSGSKRIPIPSQLDGEMLPGASGDSYYYRGFALEFASVPSDYDFKTLNLTGLSFDIIDTQPYWLSTGTSVRFRFGEDKIMEDARVERSSGKFGGDGIDKIVYEQIGGVELQLTGGELQN